MSLYDDALMGLVGREAENHLPFKPIDSHHSHPETALTQKDIKLGEHLSL